MSEFNSIVLLHWKRKMGQYSTVVSLATENRSCVYTSELLVSNIPISLSVTPLFWSQYDLLSLDRNSCCCVAAPQTPLRAREVNSTPHYKTVRPVRCAVPSDRHISGISAYTSVWFSSTKPRHLSSHIHLTFFFHPGRFSALCWIRWAQQLNSTEIFIQVNGVITVAAGGTFSRWGATSKNVCIHPDMIYLSITKI